MHPESFVESEVGQVLVTGGSSGLGAAVARTVHAACQPPLKVTT
jgi:NADP-dependent 3-hydroxy acid dehydrogenase YdfG